MNLKKQDSQGLLILKQIFSFAQNDELEFLRQLKIAQIYYKDKHWILLNTPDKAVQIYVCKEEFSTPGRYVVVKIAGHLLSRHIVLYSDLCKSIIALLREGEV